MDVCGKNTWAMMDVMSNEQWVGLDVTWMSEGIRISSLVRRMKELVEYIRINS